MCASESAARDLKLVSGKTQPTNRRNVVRRLRSQVPGNGRYYPHVFLWLESNGKPTRTSVASRRHKRHHAYSGADRDRRTC